MKLNMPLVTLLAGAALGVGVLVASVLSPASTSSASTSSASTSSARTSSAGGYGATSPASPATAGTTATAPATASSSSAIAPTTAAATAPAATAPATATAPGTAPAATASAHRADVPPKADYVGRVAGGGASVAVSIHGDKAVAYVCNGHAVAAWLRGSAVNGKLDLAGKGGARLRVDYRKAGAAGSIMADGVRYTFSAPLVHRVSSGRRPAGLYKATATVDGVSIKAGWIVLPDGSQIGSVEYDPDSAVPPTAQAPVLDLATGTARYDGVVLVASLISGISGSGF